MLRLQAFRHELEHDPELKSDFHLRMAYFWLTNMVIVAVVFFFAPGLWSKASMFYLVLVSLYANFATDFSSAGDGEPSDDEN